MKTIKSITGNTMCILAILLLVFSSISCSKDDDNNNDEVFLINIESLNSEIPAINNCDSGNGVGTGILVMVNYTSSANLTIEKIRIKYTWSNGETGNDVDVNFPDDGSSVEFGQCIRYEQLTWIEFEVRLELSDGSLSHPKTIRINKPAGAN